MRIKFIEPDPRAGETAQMDSKRGQQLIDEGAAVRISEDGSAGVPESPPTAVSARTALAISLAEALDASLAKLPGDYSEPDYVVEGMRRHYGALFTSEDEARVRAAFPAPAESVDPVIPAAPATDEVNPPAPDTPTPAQEPAPDVPAAAETAPAEEPAKQATTKSTKSTTGKK